VLSYKSSYQGNQGQVVWHGRHSTVETEFDAYLRDKVSKRLFDEEHRIDVEGDLRALATTQMASDTLRQLLRSEPDKYPWEVGEALAECLLEDEFGLQWPWNMDRDRRTPRASLPGADLVGFITEGGEVRLVLGEVKTSPDPAAPPNLMYGRSGMIHQIDRLATNSEIHWALVKWLHARCKNTSLWQNFQKAIQKYLRSGGHEFILFGILMRDTQPKELDLTNRAVAIAARLRAPCKLELDAWYLPRPIPEWPRLAKGGLS